MSLEGARRRALSHLVQSAQIYAVPITKLNTGGWLEHATLKSEAPCYLEAMDQGDMEKAGVAQTYGLSYWRAYFPAGTDINLGDRFIVDGVTYSPVTVRKHQTSEVLRLVIASTPER